MASRTQRETGREVAGVARAARQRAKQEVSDRFGAEKSTVVREIMGVAQALRATAGELEAHESALAGYAARAADAAERLGDAIEGQSLSELASQVERMCRNRPLLAGAAAMAVGFVGARLARSSAGPEIETEELEPPRRSRRSTARAEGEV
jgi:hypothetical protein